MNALNRGAPVGIGVWGRVDCVLVLTGSGHGEVKGHYSLWTKGLGTIWEGTKSLDGL